MMGSSWEHGFGRMGRQAGDWLAVIPTVHLRRRGWEEYVARGSKPRVTPNGDSWTPYHNREPDGGAIP